MASQVPPKKGVAFSVGLVLRKTDNLVITNPGTITALISKDFGDYAAIGTVTKEDTTYGQIKLALTNAEATADVIMLYVIDNTSGCVAWTETLYTAVCTIDDLKTAIDLIKAKTDYLPSDTPLDAAGLRGAVGLATANLDTQLGTKPSLAQIASEVYDILATDGLAEPGSVPAANATAFQKLAFLFMLARNKKLQTKTSPTASLCNDAGSVIATSSVTDDGETTTVNEWA